MSRVALIGENSIEYVNMLLNIWNNGDCAVLLDWRIPFSTSIKMMQEADVKKCFIEHDKYKMIDCEIPDDIGIIEFDSSIRSIECLPQCIYDKYKDNYCKSEAVVIYSSGTTGNSKGIILSHYAIQTNADSIIDYMHLSEDDCIYIAKTMSHSSTLTGELLVALKRKARVVIAPTIVPPRFILSNIEKHNVSIICLNPTLLNFVSDEYMGSSYDISSLRAIYVSGSILTDKMHEKVHNIFNNTPIYNVYGLSEAGPRVTAQREECSLSNSVGKVIKGVEIVIINEKGVLAPDGEIGIIHVNTPSRFTDYISGSIKQQPLYKDWLNTGDIGYINNSGELQIIGRSDDVIMCNSHKIYPSEIEKVVVDSIDEISECIVIKANQDNNEFIVCLYVGEKISEVKIRLILKAKLLPYEIPRRFVNLTSLPRNVNGKISKKEIIEVVNNISSMER